MQREPGRGEQIPAAGQIGAIVEVAAIGRTPTSGHDATPSEFSEVVGDQVLRLTHQIHQFADAAVAATECDDHLPSQRVTEQPEDLRCGRHLHGVNISNEFDAVLFDGY
jgi:hypothetical protein